MSLDIDTELAQLRHAYSHLIAGRVHDQQKFARGLLGPVITRLERKYEAANRKRPPSGVQSDTTE